MSPSPEAVTDARARAIAAALAQLAAHNISPDVQQLLLSGDPTQRVRPGALEKAIVAALAELMGIQVALK